MRASIYCVRTVGCGGMSLLIGSKRSYMRCRVPGACSSRSRLGGGVYRVCTIPCQCLALAFSITINDGPVGLEKGFECL